MLKYFYIVDAISVCFALARTAIFTKLFYNTCTRVLEMYLRERPDLVQTRERKLNQK